MKNLVMFVMSIQIIQFTFLPTAAAAPGMLNSESCHYSNDEGYHCHSDNVFKAECQTVTNDGIAKITRNENVNIIGLNREQLPSLERSLQRRVKQNYPQLDVKVTCEERVEELMISEPILPHDETGHSVI